ncbi:MAG: nucleotidyltransferase domain-containing protein [Dehalococcoidia bacterium]|nr:nucleotidyltransferase domain-containing protein [Dehalococcoidia bacterium]MSQ16230.1 nucleotidyltransferase domain-containing protein [Dehalococcoidia bacterium]
MDYSPEKVILFGSYARGDYDEFSDIDLIVIKKTEQRFFQRLAEVMAFIPREVAADVFVYTPQEFQAMVESGNPFIEQAIKDGIVLYEKTPGNS